MEAQRALREIADADTSQRDTVARSLARFPAAENWPYLVRGLESANPLVVYDAVEALRKNPVRPRAEDPLPYRSPSKHIRISTTALSDCLSHPSQSAPSTTSAPPRTAL